VLLQAIILFLWNKYYNASLIFNQVHQMNDCGMYISSFQIVSHNYDLIQDIDIVIEVWSGTHYCSETVVI